MKCQRATPAAPLADPPTPSPPSSTPFPPPASTRLSLSFPDLLNFAKSHLKKDVKEKDYTDICTAGEEVKELCKAKGLKILVLQPFSNFEGWPEGSPEGKDAFERAEGWIKIIQAVGTDVLQVGSCDSPSITSSTAQLAGDLAALADLLAPHSFRLAYENWCWATHAPTWRSVYDLVRVVNRPNVGLCLDTFQTAGSEWADPTTASGLIEEPGVSISELRSKFEKSLQELSKTVPSEMIYFFQISDAYKMEPPMEKDVDESGLTPRGRWSHDYRPIPFHGGYLPVVDVVRAVLGTGYRGWFSVEVFDGKEKGEVGEVAKKAMRMHERLMKEVGGEGGALGES